MEAIVVVDLVSVDEFESLLLAVELLLVVEELLLVLLSGVGESVAELCVVAIVAVDFASVDEFEAVLLAVGVLLLLLSAVGALVVEL